MPNRQKHLAKRRAPQQTKNYLRNEFALAIKFDGKSGPDTPVGKQDKQVVENKIIVDTKCVESFTLTHDAQMLGYLNITGLDLALLLNFKVWPLGKRRVLRPNFNKT